MKTKTPTILLPALLVLLTSLGACAHRQPPPVVARPVPPPLDARDIARVRNGEYVARYEVGRYVDRADPTVMHEGHPVYRVEQSARWNREPLAAPLRSAGPVRGYRPPMFRPMSASAEQTAALARLRGAEGDLTQARGQFQGAAQELHDKMAKIQTNAARVAELEANLANANAQGQGQARRIQQLEKDLAEARAKAAAPPTATDPEAATKADFERLRQFDSQANPPEGGRE